MIDHETELLVPFHDVDPMGIVWHGHYLKYFEVARCELLNVFEFGYMEMADSGYAWPVIDTRIKFIQPLRFDQRIIVTSTLKEWDYRLKIDYVIRDKENGQRLTRGYTIQAALDRTTNELCLPLPEIVKTKLAKLDK
ncbi:MAG: thioesterase family protein [Pseudomonadales bacterium]